MAMIFRFHWTLQRDIKDLYFKISIFIFLNFHNGCHIGYRVKTRHIDSGKKTMYKVLESISFRTISTGDEKFKCQLKKIQEGM